MTLPSCAVSMTTLKASSQVDREAVFRGHVGNEITRSLS